MVIIFVTDLFVCSLNLIVFTLILIFVHAVMFVSKTVYGSIRINMIRLFVFCFFVVIYLFHVSTKETILLPIRRLLQRMW